MTKLDELKKVGCIILLVSMLISLFAGCSDTNEATPPESLLESASPVQEPVSEYTAKPNEEEAYTGTIKLPLTEEKVTLTYWTTISPQIIDTVSSFSDCLIWNKMEELTNIHIEGTIIHPQAGQEKFQIMMASGEYTDMVDSPASNYSTGLEGALDDEVLVDLTDYVKNYMPNYSAIIATNEEYRKGSRVDDGRIGQIYGLQTEGYEATEGPVIRQDWLDALGLDTPGTYDDLYNVLTAFKENYNATMWIPYSGSPLGNYLGAGYGIATTYLTHMSGREPFYQVDGKVSFGPMEDEYFDHLTMLNEWYEEGLIWSDFISYTERFNSPPDSGIIGGEFGVWFSSYGNFEMWTNASEDENFHIVAFSDPVLSEGNINHLRAETFLVTKAGVGITTDCTDPALAAQLIDYWFSEEGRFLITFGIEGTTYNLDGNGHPQYTELITNNPDGLTEAQAMAVYLGSFGFHSIDHPESEYLVSSLTEDQQAAPSIWMSTSDNEYGISTSVSMTNDEAYEYNSMLSDIGTYVSVWMLQAIVGEQELTDETFEDFRGMLIDMGIEDCISFKQAALDRYNNR